MYSFTQLLTPLTFVIIYPAILVAGTYYASKKSFNNDLQLLKQQEYIFNSWGMQFSNENSQSKLPWNELFKFQESKNNLLIFTVFSATKSPLITLNK